MAKTAVIGAGSWGTALSLVLHTNGNDVIVWSIVEQEVQMLREKHEHVDKLPGVKLPEDITFTTDLKEAIEGKDYLILAVPSVFTRSTAKSMAPFVKKGQVIVCVAKGIEEKRPSVRSVCFPDRAMQRKLESDSRPQSLRVQERSLWLRVCRIFS